MNTPITIPPINCLAVHPVIEGFLFSPTSGGKDLAAGKCSEVLASLGTRVHLWPLGHRGNYATEKVASSHEIKLGSGGRAYLIPTCMPPTTRRLLRSLAKAIAKTPQTPLRAVSKAIETAYSFPLDHVESVLGSVQPKLIHVHQTQNPLVTHLQNYRSTTRCILTNHSGTLSSFVDQYDYVVFPSKWMRTKAIESTPRLSENSTVIPYFLSAEYEAFASEPTNYNPRRSGVAFIGLLENDRKGLDVLIDALGLLAIDGKPIGLHVIGEGKKKQQYQKRAAEKNVDAVFHGRLPTNENIAILNQVRIFCMPSREENFPIAQLESLACGTPVVGHAESVIELNRALGTEVGEPFDSNTQAPSRLAEIIWQWHTHKSLVFSTFASGIQSKTRELYSQERYVSAYTTIYQNFLALA